MRISSIVKALEDFAPLSYQESWDNSGMQVGTGATECTGVLVCFDATPEIVDEAVSLGCNLIVSHHPLFFKPVKRLTGASLPEITAMNAIAAGVAIYSSHTAADSAKGGVSYALAEKLGLAPLHALDPLADRLTLLRVMVPEAKADEVRLALFDAGAGALGAYECCSFNTVGDGTFRALPGSHPYVGAEGELHHERETAVEVILPSSLMSKVEAALLEVHPYECPAYMFTPMLNRLHNLGIGVYGVNDEGWTPDEFISMVKERLGCPVVRTTVMPDDPDLRIRRVAVCGGAGGSLIPAALAAGAQAYVTADIRYNDFVDFRDRILLVDAGHYETEQPIKEIFRKVILRRFPDLPVHVTGTDDNPVRYL